MQILQNILFHVSLKKLSQIGFKGHQGEKITLNK